ncbi:MAG TPA: ATPase, T2SS/T4P/T4SS family [Planctomycetota bacterium]|nr:ATPase, T2SS/T4P/T4SS family [Planctomycetota bacterium]
MSLTIENHLTFWRTVAQDLKARRTMIATLTHAKERLGQTDFAAVVDGLLLDINVGQPLSEAMGRHAAIFSRCVQTMVRAGEAGGVLDVIAERIGEGIREGIFPLPGAATREDDPALYWRAFGRLIWSGVPIIQALDLLIAEVAAPPLDAATQVIRKAILDGSDLASAMRQCGNAFPAEVIGAVALAEHKGVLDEAAFQIAEAVATNTLSSLVPDEQVKLTEPQANEAPVVKLVNQILLTAFRSRASDIHFEPQEKGLKVRYRVDGVLQEAPRPPDHLAGAIVTRIKIMADMDIAERRLPQDGRIMVRIEGRELDLRVSVVPTLFGERIVMRILDRQAILLTLDRLGLLEDDLAAIRRLCQLPHGLLLITGPVGSGKTTLLYSMLHEVDRARCCVMSAEDPVEYRLEGVAQTQIEPKRGLTYARVLRSILRQDPDIIMVGEMRDLESLQMAVQCALTGHLVMSTMHTNTAPDALRRLLDVGLEPYRINSSLAAVVAQRLVRVLCPKCKEPATPALHSVPPAAAEFIQAHPEATFCGPKGCDACHGVGYRGRTAIHEILVPDERVRQAVAASAELAALREAALAAGMKPMLINGMEKAAKGITSVVEVCRVVPDERKA